MRLDLKNLTIVADTEDEPIPMTRMGSGENWVCLHLITHLVLHNWFVNKACPVPRFIFFDQPSQAYFPPDTSAEMIRDGIQTSNSDRQSVIRMFKLIVKETKNFQVIITEHADIQEEWWDGKAKLIPLNWLTQDPLIPDAIE